MRIMCRSPFNSGAFRTELIIALSSEIHSHSLAPNKSHIASSNEVKGRREKMIYYKNDSSVQRVKERL